MLAFGDTDTQTQPPPCSVVVISHAFETVLPTHHMPIPCMAYHPVHPPKKLYGREWLSDGRSTVDQLSF